MVELVLVGARYGFFLVRWTCTSHPRIVVSYSVVLADVLVDVELERGRLASGNAGETDVFHFVAPVLQAFGLDHVQYCGW